MARLIALLVAVTVSCASSGCKGSDDDAPADTSSLPALDLGDKEADLAARRDALLSARQKISKERAALVEKRKEVISKGGDTSELDRRASELVQEDEKLQVQEGELFAAVDEYTKLQQEAIKQLAGASAGNNRAASRETLVASREKDLARREDRLGQREATLADRERGLAKRERETCGAGEPTTIIQTVDAKGSKYTKRDVDPMLERARREMSKKGILRSDLPGAVQGLESEATKAMAKGDYGRAHFAARQLVRSVRGLSINRAFLAAKISRLNRRIRGRKLSSGKQKQVDDLFRQATSNYGDGRFSSANNKLNKIYGLLR